MLLALKSKLSVNLIWLSAIDQAVDGGVKPLSKNKPYASLLEMGT